MSTVLHPVGPEPPQTYWVRRVLVVLPLALVLVVVAVLVGNRGSQSGAAPLVVASPSPLPSDRSTVDELSPTPTPASSSPETKDSADSTKDTKPKKPASAEKTTAPTPTCNPADLRTTLTGKQRIKAKQKLVFNLSLINGGPAACIVDVSSATFELKIYSGIDRIWSTADCPKQLKSTRRTVGPEQAVEWQQSWNGKRSAPNCKTRPEVPRPGTYFATAQLEKAKPVQLGMTLS